ncbi:unnamed protein product [Oppiella nova]|uniref:Lipase n=1 Tax=Oppiella nova TaxID=334625 RepID=A0A7R9LPJ6_9ACAR|nr:unnamed protein product [Oppiella nova]CAG2165712.1 unnamed protein product [Oppiella nova]
MVITQFIQSRGFESETYWVTTDDGYILQLFRIVNPYISVDQLKTTPVLLWHGISDSAEAWLFNRKGYLNTDGVYSEDNGTLVNNCDQNLTSTLAFTLAACGWDVWLANTRGNQYSDKHITLNTTDPKFWDYTLTEQAIYDIPATVGKILELTNKKRLTYIGISLGTTQIQLTTGFGTPREISEFMGQYICGNIALRYICVIYNDLLYGKDDTNTDLDRQAVYFANTNDYVSSRVFIHLAQFILTNRFAKFDFGFTENLIRYKTFSPPDYPLHDIESKDIILVNEKSFDSFISLDLLSKLRFAKFDFGFTENLIRYKTFSPPDYPLHDIESKDIILVNGLNDILADIYAN